MNTLAILVRFFKTKCHAFVQDQMSCKCHCVWIWSEICVSRYSNLLNAFFTGNTFNKHDMSAENNWSLGLSWNIHPVISRRKVAYLVFSLGSNLKISLIEGKYNQGRLIYFVSEGLWVLLKPLKERIHLNPNRMSRAQCTQETERRVFGLQGARKTTPWSKRKLS